MKLKQIIMGILISLLFLSCKCQSQEEKCNQRVSVLWLKNKIPATVCIPIPPLARASWLVP